MKVAEGFPCPACGDTHTVETGPPTRRVAVTSWYFICAQCGSRTTVNTDHPGR